MRISNTEIKYLAKQFQETYRGTIDPMIRAQLKTDDDSSGDRIAEIVEMHALGAAAAGLGVAWLPGAGSTAAALALVGFIWSMYFRINSAIGLKMSKTILKALASAVMSNIAQTAMSVVGTWALATILSFTGVANVASSLMMAALNYAIVTVGGIIYLKLLMGLFAAGKNPAEMNEGQLKRAAKSVMKNEDIKSMLKNAKQGYEDARKSGDVTGNEHIDIEDDDD